ncbi:MAG: hypothetical protein COW00_06760 [Bdellovibrio sp. CG12_big_fil_rev_8_21_14_0_65_39_13]|nr:MAG: hypothetical protein COW78_10610 [Bdellovibrio sp. CG22_combo_CG10-13_8_21_14_all_39_27]PIQ60453.1 MAG: hypothetical protein COW00_06760 [Bdellovibrio sp. CG12_big_fil_rev_8_21_14_0_65_39_13]PIR36103.1 MAG: hypothetical protein COV37_04995 [Bdellovibrio sp. CG11_big_fil_rev_8_21_14_0_20_39_38]
MRVLTVILTLFIASMAYSADFVTTETTTLDLLAHQNHQKFNRTRSDYLSDLIKWNPSWINRKIPTGTEINLRYPYPPHLGFGSLEAKNKIDSYDNLKLNVGLAMSYGAYSQSGATTKIDFKQNSPATLQVMSTNKLSIKWFIDGSVYLSKIMDAKVSGANNGGARIPYDFGTNIYFGRNVKSERFGIYGGHDFERFYLFDMTKLETLNEIEVYSSNLHYATLGLKYTHGKYLLKLSGSIVMNGSSDIANEISGHKWIAFMGRIINESFGLGMFVKNHDLNYNNRSVKSVRYGLSIYTTL